MSRVNVGRFAEMEAELYDYIIDQRDQGFCVTGGMIRAVALRILAGSNFQASNGWLTRFLCRHRLAVRRITTSGRDLPANIGATINAFLNECEPFMDILFGFFGLDFLFDQAPCHTTSKSKATFASASACVHWVLKRTTSFLEPADQSWMTPLKASYFRKWNNWLINAPKAYTKAHNMQSPVMLEVMLEWLVGLVRLGKSLTRT